jgi:regulator of replication initiation timing
MPEQQSLKDIKEIVSSMKELHEHIKDMVETFAKLPSGKHRGISGDLLLTTKEKEVLKIIQREQGRADHLVKIFTEVVHGKRP